jgi:hypothetical protein
VTAVDWSPTATATAIAGPVELERRAHAETRRRLGVANATIERLRDELACAQDGSAGAWEDLVRRQSARIEALQASQLVRDVEMADHLNRHVCKPRPPVVSG